MDYPKLRLQMTLSDNLMSFDVDVGTRQQREGKAFKFQLTNAINPRLLPSPPFPPRSGKDGVWLRNLCARKQLAPSGNRDLSGEGNVEGGFVLEEGLLQLSDQRCYRIRTATTHEKELKSQMAMGRAPKEIE